MAVSRSQRAPRRGALFSFLAAALVAGVGGAEALPGCGPARVDLQTRVVHVTDGDTLVLSGGERLRLIGINAPELGHGNAPDQPLAREAHALLLRLLSDGDNRVKLQIGEDRRDRHGRLLAHAYLEDGRSLNAALLAEGLAFAITVPPNLAHQGCYQDSEQAARVAQAGLWSRAQDQVRDSAALKASDTGFAVIRGRVTGTRQTRKSVWIALAGNVQLRIARADLDRFPAGFTDGLPQRLVEARGWLYADRDRLQLRVRHPASLRVIE